MLTLFAVTIKDTSPTQCVVVWDVELSCKNLSEYLNTRGVNTTVEVVDDFYPSGYDEAPNSVLQMVDTYLNNS